MIGSKINIIHKSGENMFIVLRDPIQIPRVRIIDDKNIPDMQWDQISIAADVCDHNYVKIVEQTRSGDEMVTIIQKCTKCFHVK